MTTSRGLASYSILIILVLVCMTGPKAHAQSAQQRSKGPKPPSHEEVMRRALSEVKSATNVPVAAPTTPRLDPPVARSLPTNVTRSIPNTPAPAAQPVTELRSTNPPPMLRPQPETVVARAPASTNFTKTESPSSALNVTPPVAKPVKGPKFSELPPDLRPRSETNQPPAASTNGSFPSTQANPISSTNVMDGLDEKHLLAIGDRLSFRIVEDQEDPRGLTVMDSGELEVPYVGRVAAVGRSCKELALTLKTELEKEYYYKATIVLAVDLMARSRGKVYLVGAVRMPGPLEIPSDEVLTLSKAILRAGGFTDFADKKNVKVTRKSNAPGGGDQTYMVNVAETLEKGRSELDLPLEPGDLIYVQERLIRF